MKGPRLDQVLLELGYVDEAGIARGLARQRAAGGRLGRSLVQLGVLSEAQLVEALGRQFGLPWTLVTERDLRAELLARMPPPPGPESGIAVPLAWADETSTLTLGVGDPTDGEAVDRVRRAFGARRVRLRIVPDSTLARIAERAHVRGPRTPEEEAATRVELPEVFHLEERTPTSLGEGAAAAGGEAPIAGRVLMIAEGAARQNFLPAIFAREGWSLVVASELDAVAEALRGERFDAVLVSSALAPRFREWLRDARVVSPGVEVQLFSSISDALLQNPVPYEAMAASMRATVRLVQELQASADAAAAGSIPRRRMAEEATALARGKGVTRLGVDGLHLAVHLLPSAERPAGEPPPSPARPEGLDRSFELARRLGFPWPVERVLARFGEIVSGERPPAPTDVALTEGECAGQLLALVWFRHMILGPARGRRGARLRDAIREGGRPYAQPDLLHAYVRLLEGRETEIGPLRQVLLVGRERFAAVLAGRLARSGIRTVATGDPSDGATMVRRSPPAALVVERDAFPAEAETLLRSATDSPALLRFAFTESSRPGLALELFGAGADDVFTPPHDFDLLAARIARAIESRARVSPEAGAPSSPDGRLAASFEAFSFLDLLQALAHGLRSVRIELEGGDRETAEIYLERGRLVHAECGDRVGEEAVYRVIAWEDDGRFDVFPVSSFPKPTIRTSVEGVLMEGCRLLDESRA